MWPPSFARMGTVTDEAGCRVQGLVVRSMAELAGGRGQRPQDRRPNAL